MAPGMSLFTLRLSRKLIHLYRSMDVRLLCTSQPCDADSRESGRYVACLQPYFFWRYSEGFYYQVSINILNYLKQLSLTNFCWNCRKVQTESATGSSSSSRVRTTLSIEVEAVDFDTQACMLRLKGRNVEENPYVKVLISVQCPLDPSNQLNIYRWERTTPLM